MSKVFRRPMFRKGGNVGEGIMTGIRDNFSHVYKLETKTNWNEITKNQLNEIKNIWFK